MSTCLGLYIGNNLIKYAKVSKDNDKVKIDSFGMKFYDKLEESIQQVIEETYSYKTPISINLSNEEYDYFSLFSLLNKKDMHNVINTEFESRCNDKGINKEGFETRYVLVEDFTDKEKIKAIHVSANKADIEKKIQQLEGYKVSSISPIGISIANLLEHKEKENALIVNIEDKTTITTIMDKKIVDVEVLEEGTSQILNNINMKENSYLKAYEICKNTTIYTNAGQDLQYEENQYLDDIMPTLYNIVGQIRKITNESLIKIDKVYITGTASVISNIDIYFQEYLTEMKCEILKPYFIQNVQAKINMKDYIEVNSAIALALQGLKDGIKGVNFKKENLADKLPEWLTQEIGSGSKNLKAGSKFSLEFDFKSKLTALESNLMRIITAILLIIILYTTSTTFILQAMNKKMQEISKAKTNVTNQIELVNKDIETIKTNTSKYISMKEKLQSINDKISDKNKTKNAIPNLLNRIMYIIPTEVQITSIENITGNHVTINAQALTYEQLGYFTAKLKVDGILTNIVSDSGQKQENVVKITIEGDLP
ncbi:MAG: hypothetical protein HFJ53_05595 [Clostridia bacterium]|nr:hypothetical protein [Clostridia bacterium]